MNFKRIKRPGFLNRLWTYKCPNSNTSFTWLWFTTVHWQAQAPEAVPLGKILDPLLDPLLHYVKVFNKWYIFPGCSVKYLTISGEEPTYSCCTFHVLQQMAPGIFIQSPWKLLLKKNKESSSVVQVCDLWSEDLVNCRA